MRKIARAGLLFLFVSYLNFPLFGQSVIWQENFNAYTNGAATASENRLPSGTGWTRNIAAATTLPPVYFQAENNTCRAGNTTWPIVWKSEAINISTYNRIYISTTITSRSSGPVTINNSGKSVFWTELVIHRK